MAAVAGRGSLPVVDVDEDDDGHLEDPWTGEVITSPGRDFLVTVRTTAR